MRKASCDFTCMVPTIFFEENIISQLIAASRQKKLEQLVLIAQVRINNTKVEFHCSSLIVDQNSEISIREDEVPIFLKVLSDSEYRQPVNNEIEAMKEGFYEMMEETSNQYNANNIYSLISDVAFMNNQLNVRISLFCPKSSIEIEEIDSSDAPSVSSIPGATYRFPKDKKLKDPNSIYAIYYGINGIKDPRIYSLSYSIYLQQHKKIHAAFNSKLYRIIFHENDEFELLTTEFSVSKPSAITARFNFSTQKNDNPDFGKHNNNINVESYGIQSKPVFELPNEIYESMDSMKQEINDLREMINEQGRQFESKIEDHNDEIKTLLQAILNEVQKTHSIERSNSKSFLHRQISRKPVIPLEISLTTIFENCQSSDEVSYPQQKYQKFQQQSLPQHQPTQQKQQSRLAVENSNPQVLPTQNQNKVFASNANISTEQNQSIERQRPKYSIDMKTSFEKKQSAARDPLNTSAPSIAAAKKVSQLQIAQASANNTNNSLNTSALGNISNIKNVTNTNNKSSNANSSNSKVNLNNLKYGANSNNRASKQSLANIENRSDNNEFASKYSKQSTKFSNQLFNEPSFDISTNIPDSINDSPNRKGSGGMNDPNDLSFIMNNEYSMETKKLLKILSLDDKKSNS